MSEIMLTIVANVVALASLLAVLRTIEEMRLQRTSTYAADLFVSAASAHVAWTWSSPLHVRVSGHPITDAEAVQLTDLKPAHVPCSNLGVGVAKRLVCEWAFDPEEFAHFVRSCSERASLEVSEHIIGLVTRVGRESQSEVLLARDHLVELPFVMPSSGTSVEACLIPAPKEYLYLAAAVAAALGDGVFSGMSRLPELRMHMTYEERDGRRHRREHIFEAWVSYPTPAVSERVGIGGLVTIRSVKETKPTAA